MSDATEISIRLSPDLLAYVDRQCLRHVVSREKMVVSLVKMWRKREAQVVARLRALDFSPCPPVAVMADQ